MNLKNIVVHTIFCAHYAIALYVYLFGLKPPKDFLAVRIIFGGPFKYLTCWDLVFQTVYFHIALLNDFFGTNAIEYNKQSKLQKIRDLYFSTVAFSTAAIVSIVFWILYLLNRELIFPKALDVFFPVWLNHSIHTAPLVCALVEMFLCPHSYPSQKKGFMVVFCEMAIYFAWVCIIAAKTGHWVYPILQNLTFIGKMAFVAGVAILTFAFYMIGDTLNRTYWVTQKSKKQR